ncbi:MAG: hypothetical protein AB7O68_10840 [Pirellulales bacterium]
MDQKIENPKSIWLFVASFAAGGGFVAMLNRLHQFSEQGDVALTASLLGAAIGLFAWAIGLLFDRGNIGVAVGALI